MSIRTFQELKEVLFSFVGNPGKSWDGPTDISGNPVDMQADGQVRRIPCQSDINTARLNSGTYTPEQRHDFWEQVRQAKDPMFVRFPGNPDKLPTSIPEVTCPQCGQIFRSLKANKEAICCFRCNLGELCPVLRGRYVVAHWICDSWQMESFSNSDPPYNTTFQWSNFASGDSICHQNLIVCRAEGKKINKLVLSTLAPTARRCYKVIFDIAGPIKFARIDGTRSANHEYTESKEMGWFDNVLLLDFIVAMLPLRMRMSYTRHP